MTLDIPARRKLRLVSKPSELDISRLKTLARELREWATQSNWPDLAERLIQAAESLEVQAVELEVGFYSIRERPLRVECGRLQRCIPTPTKTAAHRPPLSGS